MLGLGFAHAWDESESVHFACRGPDVLAQENILFTHITKTHLFKYIENFTNKNDFFFSDKNSDIFHISAQNIDYGYSLEPHRRGASNDCPQSLFLSRNKKNSLYPCNFTPVLLYKSGV